MIKYNDRFSFERDPYNWILMDYAGKSPGMLRKSPRRTYHANLAQVCHHMIERSAGCCDSLEEVCESMKQLEGHLAGALESALGYRLARLGGEHD